MISRICASSPKPGQPPRLASSMPFGLPPDTPRRRAYGPRCRNPEFSVRKEERSGHALLLYYAQKRAIRKDQSLSKNRELEALSAAMATPALPDHLGNRIRTLNTPANIALERYGYFVAVPHSRCSRAHSVQTSLMCWDLHSLFYRHVDMYVHRSWHAHLD